MEQNFCDIVRTMSSNDPSRPPTQPPPPPPPPPETDSFVPFLVGAGVAVALCGALFVQWRIADEEARRQKAAALIIQMLMQGRQKRKKRKRVDEHGAIVKRKYVFWDRE